MKEVFIVDHVRTPRARRKGKFSSVHPVDLLAHALKGITTRTKIPAEQIEDTIIGCVTQTDEQGWCVGRAAVLAAGWPITVPATTINRLCGSGQQATSFGAQAILSGTHDLVVTGGLEHMTRVPMFSDSGGETSPMLKARFPDLVHQGLAAELLAKEYKIARSDMDQFSYESHMKAKKAQDGGHFKKSIIPVSYLDAEGKQATLDFDDNVRADSNVQALAGLKPVFKDDGVITAGNASAIVDGAGAILLASGEKAKELGLKPRVRIVAMAQVGSDPKIMLTGPVAASQLALKKAGLRKDQIDIWEINEAFAPVPMFVQRTLEIDPTRINVNGGGISLGHPLGATGAILIGTAVDELERTNKRYALITMCIGIGMATATIVERV